MSPGRPGRTVTVTAVGHPAIRATHAKTLELTADAAITPRATCVAGVSASLDAEALAQLRGPVSFELVAGSWRGGGEAVINPHHAVAGGFVIRRSRHADPGTLAVAATVAAADLARELAAALAQPGQAVTFTVTEQHPPSPLVILAPGEPAGRVGLLWRNAGAAVDLSAPRYADGPPRGRSASGRAASLDSPIDASPGAGPAAVMEAGGTIRVLTSTPPGLLGPAAVARIHALTTGGAAGAGGARLACPNDPVAGALLAAGLPPAPALHLGRVTARRSSQPDLQDLVSLTPCPVVLTAPASEVLDVAGALRVLAPLRACWVDDAALDVGVALVPFGSAADLRHRWPDGPGDDDGDRLVVVGPAGPGGGRVVGLDAVVLHLRGAGVPGRQIADALRPLGLRRSEIYRIVGDQSTPTTDGAAAAPGDDDDNEH